MANEEKEKLKKKRISEYNRIFKELSQEKKKLIKKSIEQAVHMELPQSKNEDDDEEFKQFLMDRVKR